MPNSLSTTGDYTSTSYPNSQLKDGVTTVSNNTGWLGVIANGATTTLSFASPTGVEQIELMAVNNYRPSAFVVETKNADNSWTPVASGSETDFAAWADSSSVRAVKHFGVVTTTAIRVRFTASSSG